MRSLKHLVIEHASLLCNYGVIAQQLARKPLSGKLTASAAYGNIRSHDQTADRRATFHSRLHGAGAAARVRALAGRARCPLRTAPHVRPGDRARPAQPHVREPCAARARARRPSVGASAARGSACCGRRLISRLPIGCRPKGVIRQGFRPVAQRSRAHAALGAAVRDLRAKRGISQEDLADLSGMHRTYLGGIERGNRNPSYTNIRRIADALHVRTSELLIRAEELESDENGTDRTQS
jgi:DNA-binding XRE family transcriptional regulator